MAEQHDDAAGEREDPARVQEEIEQTRADLAETVGALGERLDVRSRARRRIGELREQHGTEIAVGAGVVAAGLVALVVWRRRR